MIRKTIFWLHLGVGLCLAVFIGLTAATGVLLTYERQIVRWAQNAAIIQPEQAEPLSYDALVQAAEELGAGPGNQILVPRGREGAVIVSTGRRNSFVMNPYTGERVEGAGEQTKAVFRRIMFIHRWLAFWGGRNEVGAQLNGAANLGFALLVVSGLYLWLPKLWRWPLLKPRLVFLRAAPNAKARHFNWHHVAGLWFAIPLLIISLTGAVFSYEWANRLVYAAYGETPPQSRGGGEGAKTEQEPVFSGETGTYDQMVDLAIADYGVPRRVQITLPAPEADTVRLALDHGNGVQRGLINTVQISRDGRSLTPVDAQAANSPGRKARIFIRFLHTGEVFGLVGQTLAGLASVFALLLVYSGLCLGAARVWMMYKRRKSQAG